MAQRALVTFHWSLDWPAVMLTLKQGKPLSSPMFYAEESRITECHLRIDRGDTRCIDGNIVTDIFLCRRGKYGPNRVKIVYELCIIPDGIPQRFTQTFEKLESDDRCSYNKQNSLQISRKISINKWTVVCHIFSCDADKSTKLDADEDDLKCLSGNLAKMLRNSLFSDGVIRIAKKDFKIHKDILKVRCPALLKEKEARRLLKSYSAKSIEMILHYLYSGKLDSSDNVEIPEELYNFHANYQTSVRHVLTSFPRFTLAETRFTGKSFSFNWEIQNFLNRSLDKECIYSITEIDGFPWFTFRFFRNEQEKGEHIFEFVVERVGSTSDLVVRCLLDARFIYDSIENIAYENLLDSCHYFQEKDVWKTSLKDLWKRIKEQQPDKSKDIFKTNFSIEFLVKFTICDGKKTSIQYSNVQSNSNSLDFKALHILGQDMKKLVEESDYWDFELEVGEKIFCLHKSILSARSPKLRRIFQVKNQKNLKRQVIENLEEKVASSMISYIYSAQINEDLDVDLAIKLYIAAQTYEIPSLKKKCKKFLASSLNATNINQIESFAHKECITDLKKSVHDFKSKFQRTN